MAQSIREVMTPDPTTVQASSTVTEAARAMREHDIGDVIVLQDGRMCGVLTDRDIAIRAIADGRDPSSTKVGDVCSGDVVALSPNDTIEDAVRRMRERAVRRMPVVEDGKPIGIVSIGDLAVERDPDSALADISGAPPNR